MISTRLPIQASQVSVCVWLCDLPAALSGGLASISGCPGGQRPANRTDNRFAGALPALPTASWALSET